MLYDIINTYEWFFCYNWHTLCSSNKLLDFSITFCFLVKYAIWISNMNELLPHPLLCWYATNGAGGLRSGNQLILGDAQQYSDIKFLDIRLFLSLSVDLTSHFANFADFRQLQILNARTKYYEILPAHTTTPHNTINKITNRYFEFKYHFSTLQKKFRLLLNKGVQMCQKPHTLGSENNWGMQSKTGLRNLWGNIVFLILCQGIKCHCS